MKRSWAGQAVLGLAISFATTVSAADGEQELAVEDCPAAVQKTLHDETRGAKVDGVVKETQDGKTTYWAGVEAGGRLYGVGIAENGVLLEMSLDVGEDEVSVTDCPGPVRKMLLSQSKGAKVEVVHKDLKYGGVVYEAAAEVGGKTYQLVIGEEGTLIEKTLIVEELEIALADTPEAVQKTFREEGKGGAVHTVSKDPKSAGGSIYGATVVIGGKDYEVIVSEDGTLIELSLLVKEELIKFTDCPEKVQHSFRTEAGSAKITDVTRSIGMHGNLYSTDVAIHGKTYTIELQDSGMLISKSLNDDH